MNVLWLGVYEWQCFPARTSKQGLKYTQFKEQICYNNKKNWLADFEHTPACKRFSSDGLLILANLFKIRQGGFTGASVACSQILGTPVCLSCCFSGWGLLVLDQELQNAQHACEWLSQKANRSTGKSLTQNQMFQYICAEAFLAHRVWALVLLTYRGTAILWQEPLVLVQNGYWSRSLVKPLFLPYT